jgi:hypothetical protein
VFLTGKPFQHSLVFVGKAKSLPERGNLSRASLKGMPLALPTNIKLGKKGLPGTNTIAYYKNPQITTVKSFIGLVTDHHF